MLYRLSKITLLNERGLSTESIIIESTLTLNMNMTDQLKS